MVREQKKMDREKRIMDAASRLFSSKGYNETSMNEIAGEANLAVGTLYNYFKSKDVLFIHMLLSQLNFDLEHPDTDEGGSSHSVASVLLMVVSPFIDVIPDYGKALWRDFMVAVLSNRHSLDSDVFALDWLLVGKLVEVLEHLKEHGAVRQDLDLEKVSMTLFGSLLLCMNMYIMVPEMDINGLKEELLSAFTIIEKGLLP